MMPEQGTWRISTAYDYVNDLDVPDLAWEFLRRNPEYRQDYARLKHQGREEPKAGSGALSDKWGLPFAVDPEIPAPKANAVWVPMTDPWTIILQTLPTWLAPVRPGAPPSPLETSANIYTRIAVGDQVVRASTVGLEDARAAPAALILLDELTPDRLEALARYWRCLHSPPGPSDPRVTPQRRQRLCQMLRAVDARLERQTYRAIAMTLYPEHRIEAASWAGDALREMTIRLARDGMKLVHGGYRDLLKRPRKL